MPNSLEILLSTACISSDIDRPSTSLVSVGNIPSSACAWSFSNWIISLEQFVDLCVFPSFLFCSSTYKPVDDFIIYASSYAKNTQLCTIDIAKV